jgi:hypothetical protein
MIKFLTISSFLIHKILTEGKGIYANLPQEQVVFKVAKESQVKKLDLTPITNYHSLYGIKEEKLKVKSYQVTQRDAKSSKAFWFQTT